MPCVVTEAQIMELMCATHFVPASNNYIHRQPPALHTLVIPILSAAAWTMIQASSQRSEQQCSSSKKTTAINLVQLLLSSFTFYYSFLHHLENGSCVSLARLLQLLLNLCSPSPFQTADIKILLPLKQHRSRSLYAPFLSSISFLPHSHPPFL